MRHRLLTFGLLIYGTATAQVILPSINTHQHASSAEDVEWDHVKKSSDIDALEHFDARYPKSRHHSQIIKRVAELKKTSQEPVSTEMTEGNRYRLVETKDSKTGGVVMKAVPDSGEGTKQ